ncbi:hypothetical protein Q7C36_000884 [Tachysurus vachellii]|uniref:Uncharacterized protein n=1 Tax=Tachysurus vachellii TaxID=175792 RepID=A0AA88T9H7_TACVA|nr:hypothetical protein Q7C36_000884 [Tachysurus vachellii]
MRAETLIIDLILLSLSHGQQMDSKMISFSPGVHLFVKGVHVKTVAPKLQILLPLELWMETCDASMPDGMFTALGLFYPKPGYKLKRDDVYRCEVEQNGIIYHEEVWPSNCEQTP